METTSKAAKRLAAILAIGVAASSPLPGQGGGNASGPTGAAQSQESGDSEETGRTASEAPSDRSQALAFSTKHAHFSPAEWSELPGWHEDDLRDAWRAFRKSCRVLGKRQVWEEACARSTSVGAGSNDAIRAFFEREFTLYQVSNADRSPAGVITGYYEPLLNGSRGYGFPHIYPVYATPDDMLQLDIRMLPAKVRAAPVPARIDGRKVIPVLNAVGEARQGIYTLDIGGAQADVRDKKVRLRVDGTRIVPYFTRAEIERSGLSRARVLLWVDSPAAFYSMQIQGSGKVRLPSGEVVRLAYAEQNGHPFSPTLAAGNSGKSRAILTRGSSGELMVDGNMESAEDAASGDGQVILTRGLRLSAAAVAAPAPVTRALPKGQELPPEVEEIVTALLQGRPAAVSNRPPYPQPDKTGSGSGRSKSSAPPAARAPENAASNGKQAIKSPPLQTAPDPGRLIGAAWPAEISADPSYVFFREIPDSDEGPVGALGVTLTAGRSLAVDPRTTPLGFPVFVATTLPGKRESLNRLMLAQDTGGAIRGPVRGDYFWGFGTDAGVRASRMKESARMWLLLPKGQQIAARDQAMRVRSIGGAAGSDVDCLVADPELCVEDERQ